MFMLTTETGHGFLTNSGRTWGASLLVVSLVLILYWNSRHAGFVFDDFPNIVENRDVAIRSFTPGQLWKAAFGGHSARRPVANVTFAVNRYVSGSNVAGYRVVNLAIHGINGVLVFFLATATFRQLLESRAAEPLKQTPLNPQLCGLVAAFLFAAHPIQVQSVVYVVQRMTSLATMFCLLCWLLSIHGRRTQLPSRRVFCWIAAAVCWILALGCKEFSATLPLLLLIYHGIFFGGLQRSSKWRQLGPGLAAVLLVAALAFAYLGASPWKTIAAGYSHDQFTLAERLLTQPRVIIFYITLLLFPAPARLNLLHWIETSESVSTPGTTWLSLLLLVGLFVFAVGGARRFPMFSFAVLWFLMALAVESSFISLEMIFEHRLYLPSVSVSIAVAYFVFYLTGPHTVQAIALSLTMVFCLATATYARSAIWQDPFILWSDTIVKSPRESRGFNNRGKVQLQRQQVSAAAADFDRAIELNPRFAYAFSNRGSCFVLMNRAGDALQDFSRAIALKPHLAAAYFNRGKVYAAQGDLDRALDDLNQAVTNSPRYADAINLRGVVQQRRGEYAAAIQDFTRAIDGAPEQADFYLNRGITFGLSQEYVRAIRDLTSAIERNPNDSEAYYNRGVSYSERSEFASAVADYRQAIKRSGEMAGAHNNLAWLLATAPQATIRNGTSAVRHAEIACRLTDWNNFRTLRTLAAAHAETGQFEAAIRWQRRAVSLAPKQKRAEMSSLLRRYRQLLPHRLD